MRQLRRGLDWVAPGDVELKKNSFLHVQAVRVRKAEKALTEPEASTHRSMC
jgi:hypothetical protein